MTMTATQQPDPAEVVADYLIGDVDPKVWGWAAIDKKFAHAYQYADGVAEPTSGPGAAARPVLADITARAERVRKVVARRWKAAAAAHSDPNAAPSRTLP